jgi:hypothetical protein
MAMGIMTRDGTVITDEDRTITSDMTITTTGVMFIMTTVGITISRRFGRISKMFTMRVMKSNQIARSCAGIIRS